MLKLYFLITWQQLCVYLLSDCYVYPLRLFINLHDDCYKKLNANVKYLVRAPTVQCRIRINKQYWFNAVEFSGSITWMYFLRNARLTKNFAVLGVDRRMVRMVRFKVCRSQRVKARGEYRTNYKFRHFTVSLCRHASLDESPSLTLILRFDLMRQTRWTFHTHRVNDISLPWRHTSLVPKNTPLFLKPRRVTAQKVSRPLEHRARQRWSRCVCVTLHKCYAIFVEPTYL